MEPGLRDREYSAAAASRCRGASLQWSPVLETGNTIFDRSPAISEYVAAMEPGLRDREYVPNSEAA